ncbi:MAG: DEAD/DEAH box helicase [Candidatus Latescibacterota bacterium]
MGQLTHSRAPEHRSHPPAPPNTPAAVREIIAQYQRFLRTSYRFLDDHLRAQFEAHLGQSDVVVRGPYVTLAREYARGRTLAQVVQAGDLHPALLGLSWPFGGEPLYAHQERAVRAGRAGRPFVVTTGTGSGKTEAFLLPLMDGIVRRKSEGVTGVQAILLYPMNALANDQLERLRRCLRGSGVDLSFGLYTGDSDAAARSLGEAPAETELQSRAAIRATPPDILLTNYKQLEFLLVRRSDRHLFTAGLRYLVLDEVHSYRGALATEVACLLRRLKVMAGLSAGQLVTIGTSATVAGAPGATARLAAFVTSLFGEAVAEADIIGEEHAPGRERGAGWTPPVPALADSDLTDLDTADDGTVVGLAARLTGRICPREGPIASRVGAVLAGNRVVAVLEAALAQPASLDLAAERVQAGVEGRGEVPLEDVRREAEAYLLVGSIGDDEHPPRLRPKLHTFFHGVYDVALCLGPECRTLVPQGATQCPRCGSLALPAALCRTCGQDFVKARLEAGTEARLVGTGDFYSDPHTVFLTHQVRDLPEAPTTDDGAEGEPEPGPPRRGRRAEAEDRLEPVAVCPVCARLLDAAAACPECAVAGVAMLMRRGGLSTCPACRDVYPRGDIVTPLRTGTASTVSVLASHHLDALRAEERKLLVFADNRQDAAHQAGYMADKHRAFALRHLVTRVTRESGDQGTYLAGVPEQLFDYYRELGIVRQRPTRGERAQWLEALTYEAANEFTRHSRQRASLENLGLVGVEYEFLDELAAEGRMGVAAQAAGLEVSVATNLVRAVLDAMRRARAVAYPFCQEYIDPARRRRYRELEAEPYNVRFPDRDRVPRAFALDRPDHIRRSGRLLGFVQENPRAGQLPAPHRLATRLIGDRQRAGAFLRAVVPLLRDCGILEEVPGFPIPPKEQVHGLAPLQVAVRVIRLHAPAASYRCNACQTWRPYFLPTCPTPRCAGGRLVPQAVDADNYYVRLYRERAPARLAAAEHSAQISGDDRARRETDFKAGRLNALVCTPTLELGVDIGPLLTVVLRNAPPTPANYAQRVGRAGRRLRIGFVSTFCAGGAHERHAFEQPEWLLAGRFQPPRLRLDNPQVVLRHLRAHLFECLQAELPTQLGDLLDDLRTPTRWRSEELEELFAEIRTRRESLVASVASVMAQDRAAERVPRYGKEDAAAVVDCAERDLTAVLERWWERVRQLDREFREYSTVGSPRQDERKAQARKRAYFEITQDRERAYVLNYLATRGLFPAYQFPLDTFSLDPGVPDTPTLYRPSAIAIEEFAPGNYVYADGRKLRSIRVLFAGGPGREGGGVGRSDAETAGRLQAFHFCEHCDEVVESGTNHCPRCGEPLPGASYVVFVDAFEAEENLRIGSEEESRQRQSHLRREALISGTGDRWQLYPYPLTPVELGQRAQVLVTNWGRLDGKTGAGSRFWLCPDCGRHLPHDRHDPEHARQVQEWRDRHARYCSGDPEQLILGYRFDTDCLVLSVPTRDDAKSIGRSAFSPAMTTLAEALLIGAGALLELEPGELAAFVRRSPQSARGEEILFYETVPGGAGYLESVAGRLPEVAAAARERLYGHHCAKACYLCLKRYGNQRWHPFFDKDRIRDLLLILSEQDPVAPEEGRPGAGLAHLERMLNDRQRGGEGPARRYPKGEIEEPLQRALDAIGDLPPAEREHEIRGEGGQVITVPDFAWPDVKLAVYCDGFAVHGRRETLELDAAKRTYLQAHGWAVLTYWGRTILRAPDACAAQVAEVYRQRPQPR